MFFNIQNIHIENFADGSFSVRTIETQAAIKMISDAKEAGSLIAAFEFSSVPDAKDRKQFKETMGVLSSLGVPLEENDFFDAVDDREFPNAPSLALLQPEHPILVLQYSYVLKKDFTLGDLAEPALDTCRFRLFERAA